MSAAKKLKALDKRMKNARTRRVVTTPVGHDLFLSVSDALPQIVAVVEAAEQLPEFFDVEGRTHSFVPLLDALDKKLGDYNGSGT